MLPFAEQSGVSGIGELTPPDVSVYPRSVVTLGMRGQHSCGGTMGKPDWVDFLFKYSYYKSVHFHWDSLCAARMTCMSLAMAHSQ